MVARSFFKNIISSPAVIQCWVERSIMFMMLSKSLIQKIFAVVRSNHCEY